MLLRGEIVSSSSAFIAKKEMLHIKEILNVLSVLKWVIDND